MRKLLQSLELSNSYFTDEAFTLCESFFSSDFTQKEFSLKHKNEVAKDVVKAVYELCIKRNVNSPATMLNLML